VSVQVAFAFVLLIGAGLLFASFRRILAVDPGFESTHVLTASVSMPASRTAISRRLDVSAGKSSHASAHCRRSRRPGRRIRFRYRTRAGESIVSPARVVASSDYMQAMRARLVGGRLFDDRDGDTAPNVAIVDQTLAARFWPGASAIGRRLYRPDDPNDLLRVTPTTKTFTVVGVIAPMKLESLADTRATAGAYYFPLAQQPERTLTFAVRTDADPAMASHAVLAAIQSVDPELPVFDL